MSALRQQPRSGGRGCWIAGCPPYAVKSGYLLSFLESVPDVSAKLKEANGKEIKFEEVVERAKQAAVLVLVY